ncbi:MAG TPA: hypothetical protein VFQ65_06980 [Kofleriaceae bacterium]|nr:hypothetical protein [Kofleriaceae bacterium]
MTTMPARKMFKVLCPMESRTGHKWWMRRGSAFMNKDNSINIYLDAIPTKFTSTLQLRELTEEDLRIANERRAAFSVPRNSNGVAGDHVASRHGDAGAANHAGPPAELDFPPPADAFAANHVPF